MTLAELRRLAVRQQSRIHFHLQNGMECVIDEHGIARVPALHSIPDFNLEQELAKAGEFALENAGAAAAAGDRKAGPRARSVARDALAAMVAASAPGGAANPHPGHEDE
jgi:hypothetical protein